MDYDFLSRLAERLKGSHEAEWWKNIGEIFLPELTRDVLLLSAALEKSQKENQLQAQMIEVAVDGIVAEFESIKCPKCTDKERCDASEEYCQALKKDWLKEEARKRLARVVNE